MKSVEKKIPGLHHVTAIASDPQRNLDFYVGLLGLRFVKRTVNFGRARGAEFAAPARSKPRHSRFHLGQ
jgi:catechol 2,3-dioxygenase-like lactoylglutathione lyase family enzyme